MTWYFVPKTLCFWEHLSWTQPIFWRYTLNIILVNFICSGFPFQMRTFWTLNHRGILRSAWHIARCSKEVFACFLKKEHKIWLSRWLPISVCPLPPRFRGTLYAPQYMWYMYALGIRVLAFRFRVLVSVLL